MKSNKRFGAREGFAILPNVLSGSIAFGEFYHTIIFLEFDIAGNGLAILVFISLLKLILHLKTYKTKIYSSTFFSKINNSVTIQPMQ